MTKGIRNLLFDLDGTLSDPVEGILNATRHAVSELGLEEKQEIELKYFIGPPLHEIFARQFGLEGKEITRATSVFREYYGARGYLQNRIYEGIPTMLKRLNGAGYKLFLATSKMEYFARRVVDHFALGSLFTGIAGSLPDNSRGHKDEIIACLLKEYNLDPRESLMVGDRYLDVEGARKQNMECIGVSYGFGSREELEKAGAAALADSVSELEEVILSWGK